VPPGGGQPELEFAIRIVARIAPVGTRLLNAAVTEDGGDVRSGYLSESEKRCFLFSLSRLRERVDRALSAFTRVSTRYGDSEARAG